MRPPSNPFILAGYHSPAYFCDRQQELAWLTEQFANERNSVLYSWRRMGKTSLINHFFYHLTSRRGADTVFVDLLGTTSLESANRRIAAAIVQQLGGLEKGIGASLLKLIGSIGATVGVDPLTGTPQLSFGLAPVPAAPASLQALGKYLQERSRPVVVCIDEFQQIVTYDGENAEAAFRTWTQQFPMIRFVFSGSHRHMMESMFNEASRPFYRSAQMLQLEELPEDQYADFILNAFKKGGKSIDEGLIDQVFGWSRRQTYYVQLMCNKMYGKTDRPDQQVFSEVVQEVIDQEAPVFSTYQHLLTSFQWKLLVAVANAEWVENPLAQEFLGRYGLGAASSVSSALQALLKKEFVIRTHGKYTLHDTLLMRWLQRL